MLTYHGVLDDRHLCAVIRVALRANGFTVDNAEYNRILAEQWQLGNWLREQELPRLFPAFVNVEDYNAIAEVDPYLWNRLPWIAGLGFQQTSLLHMAPVSSDVDTAVALLGATFNTAIAILDYLADERVESELFALLQGDLVRLIFDDTVNMESVFAALYNRFSSPQLRLLFALIASCGVQGRLLHRRSGNDTAWANLGNTIVTLFEAERKVSLWNFDRDTDVGSLLLALERKSAMPSLAMLQISNLALPQFKEPLTVSQQASEILGRVFLLVDDLVDLLLDCRRNTPNFLIIHLAKSNPQLGRTYIRDADVYNVVAETVKDLVEILRQEFEVSNAALSHVINFARTMVASWVDWDLDRSYVEQPLKLTTKELRSPEVIPLVSATNLLLSQQRDSYREAIHHLCFPRSYSDGIRYETHPALLSFRAVVLDGLIDAYAAGLPVPRTVLDAEALSILHAKHRDVRGGWSYITGVPELPPDADDLGQVLQELYRVGGSFLASTCDEAIRLTLDSAKPDGGFPTWILDPRGRSLLDYQMQTYLEVMGGGGIHPEVVANLLYGLILYNKARYHNALLRTIKYFENVQNEQGAWISKWYAGSYYGTYRVVLVLSYLTPNSAALCRASSFLLKSQHTDGGWGDDCSEPLSTAFAILALTALGAIEDTAIKRGTNYLIKTQQTDGGWPASTWIAFPWTEVHWQNGSNSQGMIKYSSRTIATTFCLKALLGCGWSKIHNFSGG